MTHYNFITPFLIKGTHLNLQFAYTSTVAGKVASALVVTVVLGLVRSQLVKAALPSVAPAVPCSESRSSSCRLVVIITRCQL